ncbi:MAG: Maf family nucleotide pyrophosphatase [Chitinophagaceae bacterium]|jgi:septum formation protein
MASIILASQSPRRKMLLEWARVSFEVIVSETDEEFPASLSMQEVPIYIAHHKALAVKEKVENENIRCIVAADTIVVLGNEILGKPLNREHAIDSLLKLAGKTHQVITGVSILYQGETHSFSETTQVTFHPLTPQQIEFYVDEYKPYDKAGGYAIQEWIGVVGIQNIQGDFYNVMGLPVSRLMQQLQILKVI